MTRLHDALPAHGSSMFPFVPAGSTLSLAPSDMRSVGVGDIVCYPARNGELCAHRVIALDTRPDGRWLVTRGDAVGAPEHVPLDAVAWVVARVEHRFLRYDTTSPTGRAFARIAVRRGHALRAAGWAARLLAAVTRARRRPHPPR